MYSNPAAVSAPNSSTPRQIWARCPEDNSPQSELIALELQLEIESAKEINSPTFTVLFRFDSVEVFL